ncbi:hypothetical protein [Vibrio phage J14]|nr:hypothetical protein [Vibrio phage J14]
MIFVITKIKRVVIAYVQTICKRGRYPAEFPGLFWANYL